LIGAYAVFQVVEWRHISHSIDLISYLDVGDAYWRGDFQHALNHYWSPMYSWLLGGVLAVFKPDIDHEMLAVRLTNLVVLGAFVLSAACFAATLWRRIGTLGLTWLSEPKFWIYMYSVIAVCALMLGGCDKDTPDMLVAVFVMLASNALLKIQAGERRIRNFVVMGAMLGCGYLAKAVLLPVSLFYHGLAWWCVRGERAVWKGILLSASVQLCIAGPFIAAISVTFGHPTISDSTRTLSLYSNNQNDQQVHFQFPELKHKSNIIFDNPAVYEFDDPVVGGTYPPWYNPAYWTEGAPGHDVVKRAFDFAVRNIKYFALEIFGVMLVACALSSLWLRRFVFTRAGLLDALAIALPGLVAVGIYAVTVNLWGHFMERYFIAWVVLIYAGALVAVRFPDTKSGGAAARVFLGTVCSLSLCILLLGLWMHKKMFDLFPVKLDEPIAHAMRDAGLKPGDKIAQLGFRRYFWARLARVRIVADIFDVDGFWRLSPQRREELIEVLRGHDIKAIVQTWAVEHEIADPGPGWIRIPGTRGLIYMIPEKSDKRVTSSAISSAAESNE
jgi:hypothetical protein